MDLSVAPSEGCSYQRTIAIIGGPAKFYNMYGRLLNTNQQLYTLHKPIAIFIVLDLQVSLNSHRGINNIQLFLVNSNFPLTIVRQLHHIFYVLASQVQ